MQPSAVKNVMIIVYILCMDKTRPIGSGCSLPMNKTYCIYVCIMSECPSLGQDQGLGAQTVYIPILGVRGVTGRCGDLQLFHACPCMAKPCEKGYSLGTSSAVLVRLASPYSEPTLVRYLPKWAKTMQGLGALAYMHSAAHQEYQAVDATHLGSGVHRCHAISSLQPRVCSSL